MRPDHAVHGTHTGSAGSDLEDSEHIADMPGFEPAALLQTCRMVYDEALTLHCWSNAFRSRLVPRDLFMAH